MLIKMLDGGLVNYSDDSYSYGGCPTCDYGSEYINEIDLELTKYKVSIKTNQMYDYALSEGKMIRLFLSENNRIQNMKEAEFIGWFKAKLIEIAYCDPDVIEKFDVKEV